MKTPRLRVIVGPKHAPSKAGKVGLRSETNGGSERRVPPGRGGAQHGRTRRRRRRTRQGHSLLTEAAQKVPFSATEPYRFCPADGSRLEEHRLSEIGRAHV